MRSDVQKVEIRPGSERQEGGTGRNVSEAQIVAVFSVSRGFLTNKLILSLMSMYRIYSWSFGGDVI